MIDVLHFQNLLTATGLALPLGLLLCSVRSRLLVCYLIHTIADSCYPH